METHELLFAKVRPNAKIPTKTNENAGYDIYACFDEDYLILPSLKTVLVPTGIASAMSDKYYAQIEERGSTGSKGIKKSAGVIDSSYRGEWFIAITNCNNFPFIISKLSFEELTQKYDTQIHDILFAHPANIYPYSKAIAQAVIHEVPQMAVKEIPYEELKMIPSQRGDGKLGSSGK